MAHPKKVLHQKGGDDQGEVLVDETEAGQGSDRYTTVCADAS